jgi:AbrB family looped-hinge helix DNA binding protein
MSLVKLSTNGQVTIPSALRERAGLDPGDLLEAKLEKGKITLTPKSFIDQRIDEGFEDIRKGRTYGPFDSADEMIESLRRNLKRQMKPGKSRIRKKKLEEIYIGRFGAEDYAEIKRIRWWLDTKMNKEALLAFLTDRDPFNA